MSKERPLTRDEVEAGLERLAEDRRVAVRVLKEARSEVREIDRLVKDFELRKERLNEEGQKEDQ